LFGDRQYSSAISNHLTFSEHPHKLDSCKSYRCGSKTLKPQHRIHHVSRLEFKQENIRPKNLRLSASEPRTVLVEQRRVLLKLSLRSILCFFERSLAFPWHIFCNFFPEGLS